MIAVDTDVVSELLRPRCAAAVTASANAQPAEMLFLASINAAELWAGVAVLPEGARKRASESSLEDVSNRLFAARRLPFDDAAARAHADIVRRTQAAGTPVPLAVAGPSDPFLHRTEARMTAALLLIDLQNDYFPGGAMELAGAEDAVARAQTLLAGFRQRGGPVFHVRHLATRPGATFFLPGTQGAEVHAAVTPGAQEAVVTKHFPNSFRATTLGELLQGAGVSRLVVAGMMTHLCVDTTVRAAADLGYECLLAEDGCATRALRFKGREVDAAQVQVAYLAALQGSFADVRPAQDILAGL